MLSLKAKSRMSWQAGVILGVTPGDPAGCLLLSVLAPATYKPDSVAELAANKTKGKIILSLT